MKQAEGSSIEHLKSLIITGRPEEARQECRKLLAEGFDPKEVMNQALVAGMNVVGDKWRSGEYWMPDVLLCADTMSACLDILRPYLKAADEGSKVFKIAIGTVEDDIHTIGKNIVKYMLEGAGFDVLDLGCDVPTKKFVDASKKADVIGISALMTTTMTAMPKVITAITEAGTRGKVKIIVGGAPVTESFAKKIGADEYGKDAVSAVEIIRDWSKMSR